MRDESDCSRNGCWLWVLRMCKQIDASGNNDAKANNGECDACDEGDEGLLMALGVVFDNQSGVAVRLLLGYLG
ncbi:hypothetical protein Vqi01_56480 [Micromonospora qiuiae]|uniref:Uncharacterized protein n=1 Tax=Micromonospora qiuiae TaxID=502268 RepID=A0ABQ4JJ76_9ACTN|nr:hypothetical protein Vqi01_56480 [Micromonospora qiuiae]